MVGANPDYARWDSARAWCGELGIRSNRQNYLQIEFDQLSTINGIATQGMSGYPWYAVASYSLHFSMDGDGWYKYSTPNKV